MLSKAQNSLYWREWSAAKRALMPGRSTWTKHEEETRRHEIHIRALGADKSHLDFTNADFDKVLAELRAISRPADLNAQLRQLNQQHYRLLFGIRKLASELHGAGWRRYVAGIIDHMNADGALQGSDLDQLAPADLEKIMIALRKDQARQKQPSLPAFLLS